MAAIGSLFTANIILLLFAWGVGVLILYEIIKTAVRHGVREANIPLERRLDDITLLLQAIRKDKYKDH